METDQKILNAALSLFVTKGFTATTSEITRKAGVSSGILFHYFSTKEELILTLYANILLEYYQTGFIQVDEEAMTNRETFEANIKRAWTALVEWGVHNWEKFQYLQQFENTPFTEKYKPQENPEVQKIQNYLIRQTKLAIEMGILKDLPYDYLINAGVALVVSTIKYLHENPQRRTDKDFMERALQIYLCANEQ